MSEELTTLGGVLLALLGGVVGSFIMEEVRRRRAKRVEPKLSVRPQKGLSYAHVGEDNVHCAYARLDICNHPDSKAATGVGVYIEHVECVRGGSDDDKEKLAFLEGRWLAWANVDRGDPNVSPSMRTIRANTKIDLAHLSMVSPGKSHRRRSPAAAAEKPLEPSWARNLHL